jgi:polyhydroxyalkanoate synthesis regulator phasin
MEMEKEKENKAGVSERIRESFGESLRSLSKIEAEGEKLVKGLVGTLEKVGIDAGTKAVEDFGRDSRAFLKQLNESIEEGAAKVLEGLNIPSREDLDQVNRRVKALIDEHVRLRLEKLRVPTGKDMDAMARHLRENLEEQVRKGLGRLNLATRKDMEALVKDLRKLREDVARLHPKRASKATHATARSEAQRAPKKTAATRKRPAKT